MISVASITGIAGCALLPAAMMMGVMGVRGRPIAARCVIFALFLGLAFFPVKGIPLAGYLRSLIGDVSITTLVLVVLSSVSRLSDREVYTPRSFLALMALVMAGGIFLYPFALGFTSFDPYALGYHSKSFAALLFCVAMAAWYFDFYLIQFCIIFGVSGFLLGMYESRNMWDYLIDPLIVVFALCWLPVALIRKKRKGLSAR